MELTDRFTVNASAQTVWELLWDLPRVALCLPGCESIEAIDDTNLKARFVQKVGPFQIAMDLDLAVQEISKNERIVVAGGGKDKRGNTLKLNRLVMELAPVSDGETGISYSMDFNLYGRLATPGNVIVKRKSEEMRVEFTRRITAEVEGA
ncbi:MAG: SRPBCC domain-containing protein [Dehalococcoidia bacterium]